MVVPAWLVLGLLAGFIASKMVNGTGLGVVLDMVVGVVGAMIGGLTSLVMRPVPINRFSIHSMVVAGVGSVAMLAAYHAVTRRRPI